MLSPHIVTVILTSSTLKNKIDKDNFGKKHKKTKTKKKPCEETL